MAAPRSHLLLFISDFFPAGTFSQVTSQFPESFRKSQHTVAVSLIMPACSISESPPAGTLPSGGKRKLLPVTLVAMTVFMGGAFGMAHAQDTWTTAQLSVSRTYLSATSVEKRLGLACHGGANKSCSCIGWECVFVRWGGYK